MCNLVKESGKYTTETNDNIFLLLQKNQVEIQPTENPITQIQQRTN